MDNKELQRAVNPVYLTAKGTLGLLKKAGDPDAVALLPIIGRSPCTPDHAEVCKRPEPVHGIPCPARGGKDPKNDRIRQSSALIP